MTISPRDFRDALGRFASGVTVVTIPHAGDPAGVRGITANAFISVSLEPPLVLVSIDKKARAHAPLLEAERYGVSILRAGQEDYSNHFAGFDDAVVPQFAELGGFTVLDGALAQLVCRVTDRVSAGDHTLFIGQVEALATADSEPLLYFRGRYNALASAHQS